ncbi:MAG: hypothetical protein COT14_02025, partial [Candidatus Diapherotrites archaeon CG08_land_8_20_14_0_20_30_16]
TDYGFYLRTCNSANFSKCILDTNYQKFLENNSDKNVKYFVGYGNKLYLPKQFFFLFNKKLETKYNNISLLAVIPAIGYDDTIKKEIMDRDFSLAHSSQGELDLSKIINNYNLGNILVGNIQVKNTINYYYKWDFENISSRGSFLAFLDIINNLFTKYNLKCLISKKKF